MKGLRWRTFVVAGTVCLGVYLLIPSFLKFGFGRNVPKVVKEGDPWYYHLLPSQQLKLGLDLMGGLHLVLGIDFDEVYRDAAIKFKNELKQLVDTEKLAEVTLETTSDNKIVVHYPDDKTWKKVEGLISKHLGRNLDFDSQDLNTARLRMTDESKAFVKERALDQSLETLRNRIDEFGIAEPVIQKQGQEKILVQFPGLHEVGRLKDIISRTAKLTFQIVRSGPTWPRSSQVPVPTVPYDQLLGWIEEAKKNNIQIGPETPYSKYVRDVNAFLQPKLPQDTEVLFEKQTDVNTKEVSYIPFLLDREPIVRGDELDDAYYGYDPKTNDPIVNFSLNSVGSQRFDEGTGKHVHWLMAIVLDGSVTSAPSINERISGGRAQITMGTRGRSPQEAQQDAKDTALVLRSGALPARLDFLEERDIGPSLGADSIRAGSISLSLGLLAVFIFMAIYYRGSGLVADIALFLNGLFILSALAAFEGTLTLPGLAGMTLTLGMAVDANVLIFEHMREELRSGKSVNLSIGEGFSRAFSAIVDGNLTTIIAGLVLLGFGYGPIRGFAVTMLMGLIASMYTAVFVTRVIFDHWIVSKGRTSISL